ncbi:MAG: hypothetical protein GY799_25225 [Desulfobulbaceae bacterium]|nr:hypothetical protein [Desulfobulbaceae bacterium]
MANEESLVSVAEERRKWFAKVFCQPIYEAMLSEAVGNGQVNAPGFLSDPIARAAYCETEWIKTPKTKRKNDE